MSAELMSIIGIVNGYILAGSIVNLCVSVPLLFIKRMHACFMGVPYYAWAGIVSAILIVSRFITVNSLI